MNKEKCRDCRYYKELKTLKNEKNQDIAKGLGHCSHLDKNVIGSDEQCDNGKKKEIKKKED